MLENKVNCPICGGIAGFAENPKELEKIHHKIIGKAYDFIHFLEKNYPKGKE